LGIQKFVSTFDLAEPQGYSYEAEQIAQLAHRILSEVFGFDIAGKKEEQDGRCPDRRKNHIQEQRIEDCIDLPPHKDHI
jgi:hypothetical protein